MRFFYGTVDCKFLRDEKVTQKFSVYKIVQSDINPLGLESDQYQFSSNDIHTLSRD